MLAIVLSGCQETGPKELVVAKVGAEVLPLNEVLSAIPADMSPEDSAEQATNIIQAWINRKLMYDKARFNLDAAQLDIEQQVEKYRQELFIFEYEKEILNQKLDTSVTNQEIVSFYNENQGIFQLNDYILKVRYTKLAPNTPDLENVSMWLQSSDSTSQAKLKDYCHSYAIKCFTDSNWIYFNELLRELPIEVYNKTAFLRSGKFVQFSDAEHLYLLYIIDTRSKNTLSPLTLETTRIKNLILNKRKIELLGKIRRSIYRDAISNGKAIIYDEPQYPK